MTTRTARAGSKPTSSAHPDLTAEITYLTRALKAPTMREAVTRPAERARSESWTHEEFLVACLQREALHGSPTAVRAASGQHGSPRGNRWRSSTSTTPAASNET